MPESPARKKWCKEHTTRMTIKFINSTDADILKKLSEVPNKAGYIKQVIREDINMNG